MKKILTSLALTISVAMAQNFSPPKLIVKNDYELASLQLVDLDYDGDIDVFGGSYFCINNGNGIFDTVYEPINSIIGSSDFHADDINNDGLIDVLVTDASFDQVKFFKNLGGGIYDTELILSSNSDGARGVCTADIDNDGNIDIVSSSENDGNVSYFKNLGNGTFSTKINIATGLNGSRFVNVNDIDNDGDFEILVASSLAQRVTLFYDLSPPNLSYASSTLNYSADGAQAIQVADINGDGNKDIVSCSFFNDQINWYENLGGLSFSSAINVSTSDNGVSAINLVDIDNDGDIDILSAVYLSNKINIYKNNGVGIFTLSSSIGIFQPLSVETEDLNNDGNIDIVVNTKAGGSDSAKVVWYENLGNSTGFEFNDNALDYIVYPNPATDILNIEFNNDLPNNNTQVYLYDMQGKMINISLQIMGNKIQLNVQDLAKGFYTLSVNKGDKVITKLKTMQLTTCK